MFIDDSIVKPKRAEERGEEEEEEQNQQKKAAHTGKMVTEWSVKSSANREFIFCEFERIFKKKKKNTSGIGNGDLAYGVVCVSVCVCMHVPAIFLSFIFSFKKKKKNNKPNENELFQIQKGHQTPINNSIKTNTKHQVKQRFSSTIVWIRLQSLPPPPHVYRWYECKRKKAKF